METGHIITCTFETPVGAMVLGSFNDALCLCDWPYRRSRKAVDERIQRGLDAHVRVGSSAVIEEAMIQLEAYFKGTRQTFDLPIRMVGTEFQQRVWKALLDVPYGSTTTYADLTATIAGPTAIRAVASANGANALSIIVPCHRIIGSDGALVGYAGGVPVKRRLLQLERAIAGASAPDLFNGVPA
ncbi:MAG: methylated-DNA--[protein]-cysteine S-methyltransferase [Flavobacteriales bacterium]